MKVCFKCGAEKPFSEFYKHSKMVDGYLGKCKECTKKDVSEYRKQNIEKVRLYDRNRPNHKERIALNKERARKLKEEGPEAYKERGRRSTRKYRNKFRFKYKAHCAVNNAIRDGKLLKKTSCEHCGTDSETLQGHHHSYDEEFWLDVVWLCPSCHGEEHKRLNELGRDPDKEE